MSRAYIICGTVEDALSRFPDLYFDAVFTDPPYHLQMMQRDFDRSHLQMGGSNEGQKSQAWHLRWLRPAVQKIKPGGWVVAASAGRLYHRLACAAEDAGLDIQPMFAWINGESMALGMDVSKAIDKAAGAEREVIGSKLGRPGMSSDGGNQQRRSPATADGRQAEQHLYTADITAPSTPLAQLFSGYSTRLKDAVCPWLMAHKKVDGSFAENARRWGVAGLNVEAGRVPTEESTVRNNPGSTRSPRTMAGGEYGPFIGGSTQGRYPPNAAFSPEAAAELGRQSGDSQSQTRRSGDLRPKGATLGQPNRIGPQPELNDSGTAARFFKTFRYQAKAGSSERLLGAEDHYWRVAPKNPLGFERISFEEWRGMGHLVGCRTGKANPNRIRGRDHPGGSVRSYEYDQRATGCAPGCQERQRYQGNIHPTLKPISLVQYLARLILPPPREDGQPRRILVPFSGSGSEVIGALLAGWEEVVAIEAEPVYCDLAAARIAAWAPYTPGRANAIDAGAPVAPAGNSDQMDLFG